MIKSAINLFANVVSVNLNPMTSDMQNMGYKDMQCATCMQ